MYNYQWNDEINTSMSNFHNHWPTNIGMNQLQEDLALVSSSNVFFVIFPYRLLSQVDI